MTIPGCSEWEGLSIKLLRFVVTSILPSQNAFWSEEVTFELFKISISLLILRSTLNLHIPYSHTLWSKRSFWRWFFSEKNTPSSYFMENKIIIRHRVCKRRVFDLKNRASPPTYRGPPTYRACWKSRN